MSNEDQYDEKERLLQENPKGKYPRMKFQFRLQKPTHNLILNASAFIAGIVLYLLSTQFHKLAIPFQNQIHKTVPTLAESLDDPYLLHQKLELVHITATGGFYLTNAAYKSRGILWGACHFIDSSDAGCYSPDIPNYEEVAGESPWHQTPSTLHVDFSPYKNIKLFAVVRNPYSRIITEYYNPWIGYKGGDRNNPDVMNQFLQDNLSKRGDSFLSHQHFIPQSNYVFDQNGKQVIDHVLHYENLEEEFQMLMNAYGIDIKVDWESFRKGSNRERLTPESLSSETIQMINDHAKDDFGLFGYEMINGVP